jgi:putative transposase
MADGPNQMWSWDISYLPTNVKGIWRYLYLVIDVWSRKIVAWDVEEKENSKIAAKLVARAYLKKTNQPPPPATAYLTHR